MKFQYSLRTLIIVCFVASIVLYFAVALYMDHVLALEMYARGMGIQYEANSLCRAKEHEGALLRPKAVIYDEGGSGWHFDGSEWIGVLKLSRAGQVGRNASDTFEQDGTPIYSLRISCGRTAVAVKPIEIEYDNAAENESLLAVLKKLCEEHHWQYVTRKVEHIENGK